MTIVVAVETTDPVVLEIGTAAVVVNAAVVYTGVMVSGTAGIVFSHSTFICPKLPSAAAVTVHPAAAAATAVLHTATTAVAFLFAVATTDKVVPAAATSLKTPAAASASLRMETLGW